MNFLTYLADEVSELIEVAITVWCQTKLTDPLVEFIRSLKRVHLVDLNFVLLEETQILKNKRTFYEAIYLLFNNSN